MQNKEYEKTCFDKFTAEESWNAFTDKVYDKIINLFLKYVKPKKDDKIVDMGCGTGEFTQKIKELSFKDVSGFDISAGCIRTAKKQYKGINFRAKDIENTGLIKGSVDILVYCGVLHHFTDLKKVIKEAYRILKEGGKIFIFDPNAANPVLWLFRNRKSPFKMSRLKTPNEEFLTKNQIKAAFGRERFEVVKIDCLSGVYYTKEHFRKLFPFPFFYAVYFYNLFDWLLGKTFLNKEYGSFIIGYIKKN